MGLTLWTTTGLVVWLVLWAIGAKPLDAFMVATLIIVIGATLHILRRYLPGGR
jgi:hypothetical protein